jgi:hypothetical protein
METQLIYANGFAELRRLGLLELVGDFPFD